MGLATGSQGFKVGPRVQRIVKDATCDQGSIVWKSANLEIKQLWKSRNLEIEETQKAGPEFNNKKYSTTFRMKLHHAQSFGWVLQ